MDKTVDEPPISAVLLEHCSFSQVVFNSVEKFYVPGGDVTCYYTFTQQFIPRRKDWIGIFKVSMNTKGLGTSGEVLDSMCAQSEVPNYNS